MTPDRIETLLSTEKDKYNLSNHNEVFRYCLDKVIEERCDELDYWLEDEGFEIINREMKRVATSIYNYEVIVTKS